jgi:uncharacterized protein (DUF952 family)
VLAVSPAGKSKKMGPVYLPAISVALFFFCGIFVVEKALASGLSSSPHASIYVDLNMTAFSRCLETGLYETPVLHKEGFIHASTLEGEMYVLPHYFNGSSLVPIAVVDVSKLEHAVKWVQTVPDYPPFPHVMGPINIQAVTRVVYLYLRSGEPWRLSSIQQQLLS